MYICIYVYMYICIYVYMYICIYVYMYTCIHVYMYTCTHVHMCSCVYVYVHVYVYAHTVWRVFGKPRLANLCRSRCLSRHHCQTRIPRQQAGKPLPSSQLKDSGVGSAKNPRTTPEILSEAKNYYRSISAPEKQAFRSDSMAVIVTMLAILTFRNMA